MENGNTDHWENVYDKKGPDEVSWTQEQPHTSLRFIHSFGADKSARIIDVGGGDSRLVDFLLEEGYTDITVLDISAKALEKAKRRLGAKAGLVKWIVSDITGFETSETYDIWHDRATFHFLTTPAQINRYITLAAAKVSGFMVIGTFSDNGPEKCSGLPITQYSEAALTARLETYFDKLSCITEDHITPFGTSQNFLFCGFKKKTTQAQ